MPTISMFYGILICMYFYDDVIVHRIYTPNIKERKLLFQFSMLQRIKIVEKLEQQTGQVKENGAPVITT